MIQEILNENDSFKAIKEYYDKKDISDIYGMARLENQHSSFLAWLFDPENCGNLTPIRALLLLIQKEIKANKEFSKSDLAYKSFSKLDLANAKISVDTPKREAICRIDIFITLDINGDKYAIIVENKIYSFLHDDQLGKYKRIVSESPNYKDYKIIGVFLYTKYQNKDYINSQIDEAKGNNYIPISYQTLYDEVLIPTLDSSIKKEVKSGLSEYIHMLAKPISEDGASFLIITQQDRENLNCLFKDKQLISYIKSINSVKDIPEYNKSLLLMCFNKYKLYSEEKNIVKKLEKILENKKFSFTVDLTKFKNYKTMSHMHRFIGQLLEEIFNILFENGYTYENINDKFNSMFANKLLITKEEKETIKNEKWFTKELIFDNKVYYVLNSWNTWEFEDLKKNINELNIGIKLDD